MNRGWNIIIILAMVFGIIIAIIAVNISTQSEITPTNEFFVVSISESPKIDVEDWTLRVNGLVENPLNLSYDNITNFPSTSEIVTLQCVAGPSGTANWTGVRLKAVLDMAGILHNAHEVIFYAADGYSSSLTLDYAQNPDVILAYKMNGETLPRDHGYPLRLVAPGKYGYKWVKWITHIEVVDYDYKGYWESRGYDDEADIPAYSNWGAHSIALTVSAYFGSLALISGLNYSNQVEFGKKSQKMFSRKFHFGTSIMYLGILLPVSIHRVFFTIENRGSFPNSSHGYLALAVIILGILNVSTGYLLAKKVEKMRMIHFIVTLFGFLILLGTILTGLFIIGLN
ncbi:MAG: DUF4079 family protein [Thermoplasmata archaeon]|nr:MAG: DUF4079 family protein [Thermoplasmata archaeon]